MVWITNAPHVNTISAALVPKEHVSERTKNLASGIIRRCILLVCLCLSIPIPISIPFVPLKTDEICLLSGYSHKCEACHKSVELHDKRHREIGVLRNSILQLISGKAAKNAATGANGPLTAEELERIHDALHPKAVTCRGNGDISTNPLKNQTKNKNKNSNKSVVVVVDSTITKSDKKVRKPTRNAKSCCCTRSNNRSSGTTSIKPDDPLITTILHRLGISETVISSAPNNQITKDKRFRALLTQLRTAIAADLVSVENEERETMMRMAGYWRYVNRRTYNAMVRNNSLWDWETGGKLREVDFDEVSEED